VCATNNNKLKILPPAEFPDRDNVYCWETMTSIPTPLELDGTKNSVKLADALIAAIAFIREDNTFSFVPIEETLLTRLQKDIESEDSVDKVLSLAQLAGIMSGLGEFYEAYVFYFEAYKISNSLQSNTQLSDDEKRKVEYNSLMGIGRLLSAKFKEFPVVAQKIFEHLNKSSPNQEAFEYVNR
jgi:hypothetical protein